MKIFDKIKNYFYDDPDEDDKKKDLTEKHKSSDKTDEKDLRSNKYSSDNNISERELFKTDPTFNFPIVFDDDDFKQEKTIKKPSIPVREVITKTTVETIERKTFRPSPNISPIYGLIGDDKKNEKNITSNNINDYNKSKVMNIDDVLGKTYTCTSEKVEKYINVTEEPITISSNEDLSYDFFEDKKEDEIKSRVELKKTSLNNTDVKLKTIDELLENNNDDDFYSLVDSMYKDTDEEGDL